MRMGEGNVCLRVVVRKMKSLQIFSCVDRFNSHCCFGGGSASIFMIEQTTSSNIGQIDAEYGGTTLFRNVYK